MVGLDGVERIYPRGTWFLSTRITDPSVIREFDSGKIRGFSSTTANKTFADNNIATKNKTLIKDIVDPVVMTVSVTSSPCVGGSKFCKLAYKTHKITDENDIMENNNENVFKKIGNFFLSLNDEDVTANKSTEDVDPVEQKEVEQEATANKSTEKVVVAEKADNTTINDAPTKDDDKKEDDYITKDEYTALLNRVASLEQAFKEIQDKTKDEGTDDKQDEQQGTANKSKQLDVPDINQTANKSISTTNVVLKTMGRL